MTLPAPDHLPVHLPHPYLLALFAFAVVATVMVVVLRSPKLEQRFVPLSVLSLLVFALLLIVMSLVGIYRSTFMGVRQESDTERHTAVSLRAQPALAASAASPTDSAVPGVMTVDGAATQ